MDANKFKKLQEIGYSINPACGVCKHGVFENRLEFGICNVKQYEHLKHTGEPRQLSVYRYGICNDEFDWNSKDRVLDVMGPYSVFIHSHSPER